MNSNYRIHRAIATATIAAVLLTLGGCAGMNRRQQNTATGAAIGGAAGLVLGGNAVGTAAGAAAGAFIGHEVSK
jgi:osmotically inducible lipoprotein OsmB